MTKRLKWLVTIFLGFVIGAATMILGGYLLMEITPSFEAAGIFWGGVMLSVPSGIVGALIAWNRIRRGRTDDSQ
jgi:hypothetical protein